MTRKALLLLVSLGALRDPCGTETSPAGVNAACTRTSDCEDGLACVAGVCSQSDGGGGLPPGDGASEAGADGSAAD